MFEFQQHSKNMIEELLLEMFQDLALGVYCKIDDCLMKLKRTLSPNSNSPIEKKFWVLVDINTINIIDRNLELEALDIFEKSLEHNKSPIIINLLHFSISKIHNSRASNILVKALNVFLKINLKFRK